MSLRPTGNQWDLLINGTGLISIILLAVPALYANRYAKLLARLGKLNVRSPQLKEKLDTTRKNLKELQENWTPFKSNALLLGTFLAALSYFLGLIKSIVM